MLAEDGAARADYCAVLDADHLQRALVDQADLLFVQRVLRNDRFGFQVQGRWRLVQGLTERAGGGGWGGWLEGVGLLEGALVVGER